MSYNIIKEVYLSNKHKSTFKTTHYLGENILDTPHKLQIVKYPGNEGFYLIYLDDKNDELTDTYHDDMIGALKRANWEYNIQEEDWQTI